MRIVYAASLGALALLMFGCEVESPRPARERGRVVEVVYDEPAPDQRVYVYDPGYPPGTYVYGGYYYYSGRRYDRDEFRTRVVNVNIDQRRYINVTENRRTSQQVEQTHRNEYQKQRVTAGPAPDRGGTHGMYGPSNAPPTARQPTVTPEVKRLPGNNPRAEHDSRPGDQRDKDSRDPRDPR